MKKNKKVLVFGTFDKLHPGHLDFFRQAKEYGDELTVVIARDSNVERTKGKEPAWDEDRRLRGVWEKEVVDRVLLGEEEMSYNIVLKLKPDVICLGYDQAVDMERLKKIFSGEIVRLKPYKPEIYKSSKLI